MDSVSIIRELVREALILEYQSHFFEPQIGDVVVNDNPGCKHKGSLGKVIKISSLPADGGRTATYQCMNDGPTWDKGDQLTKTFDQLVPAVSPDLAYHIENSVPITESIFRPGSESFLNLIREVRTLALRGLYNPDALESYYLYETDLGERGSFGGQSVPLDWPMPAEDLFEAEYRGKEVELNKPKRSSGPKKYQVYTKNKKGNVIKVPFGDEKGGLSEKLDDKEARDNFVSRHDCDSEAKKDKTKPGYWSCRLPRYWEDLGLKKNSFRFW